MAGSFGYELDLNLITEEEKELVRQQIKDCKKYWNVIHNGNYYRLTNPMEKTEFAAWQFVTEEKDEAILSVVTLDTEGNPPVNYIKWKGLEEKAIYVDEKTGTEYFGSALMYVGMPLPMLSDEYQAIQIYLKKIM